MIHSIEINDFRALKNINLTLGNMITVISGRNGLGKSTILALLGNTCEFKVKDGKTIFNTQFRTEFGEIFKASEEFDKSGPNKCKINFSNRENPSQIIESKICRVSWQAQKRKKGDKGIDSTDDVKGTKRFRMIPETKTGNEKNSKKMEWPTLYLGLSRLYPIGEAKEDNRFKVSTIKLTEEEKRYFTNHYVNILNINEDDELCVDVIDIGETSRKKGIGINTKQYSSISNSAGQDNIGQIIMNILSFKRLKANNSSYKGGLLLIDEIEATLHPVAQVKLVDYLYKECKNLNLQVVFTTHSVSLLKKISKKILHNNEVNNNYEVYYMTRNNGPLTVHRNPQFSFIESDLTLATPGSNIPKIPVYCEDDEGRWFFERLVKKHKLRLNLIKVKLSCDALIQLNKNDPGYFSNVIFALDGDVKDEDIIGFKNIIKLPGTQRPEKEIYDFLLNLTCDSQLWEDGEDIGFTKENIKENGPESAKYDGKPREKYKKWFQDNEIIFEELDLFDYWIDENKTLYDKFNKEFIDCYNNIARRKLIAEIKGGQK